MTASIVPIDSAKPWTVDTELKGYTVLHRKNGTAILDFEVYAVKGHGDKGERYHELQSGGGSEFTEDISKAPLYASGSVRFDGCINYRFDDQDECMLHECGRGAFAKIAKLFEHIYDLAAKAMPEHEDYLR